MDSACTQTSVKPLLDYFDSLLQLDAEEKELVTTKFHPYLYRKRQYALQHGDVCQHFHFVVRGCLRLYKVGKEGSVHVLQFATENYWIVDLASFHQLKPSQLNIDALEDTVVLRI